MSGILLDTNVLLDVLTDDPVWADWSLGQMERFALKGALVVNSAIYAETSIGFKRIEDLDRALARAGVVLAEIPRPALFLAGKAYLAYRARGGRKTGILPDFFIGAHAAVARLPLLSRDSVRYRTYFPTLDVIAPPRA